MKKSSSCILFFSIALLLLACKGKQDKHSSLAIKKVAADIAKTNVLMGGSVGFADERPEQWDRYEALRSKASNKELLALTNDTNSVVRCYAFQALAAGKSTNLFSVVIQHLSDTAIVHTLYGCLGGSQKVGDFFLSTVTANTDNGRYYRLNEKQKAIVDSLLLFGSGNSLEARDRLLTEIEPVETQYVRIKQLLTAENDKLAIVPLSKYKKQQDIPLIKASLNDPASRLFVFAAIRNFPDQSFFPVLQKTLKAEVTKENNGNDERLQLLYEAIVQYKDQPSRELLKLALNEAKDMQFVYHMDYLQQALRKYPSPVYEGLVKPVFTGRPLR